MKREQQLPKMRFLNICATAQFTPIGLALMAQVPTWTVYAMLDRQRVTRDQAQKVLDTLNEFNPLKGAVTYTLENVDIVLIGEGCEQEEADSSQEQTI